MRLTEIGDKEIVDLANGSMHGKLWDAEILFDAHSGLIHALLVPDFEAAALISKKICSSPGNRL